MITYRSRSVPLALVVAMWTWACPAAELAPDVPELDVPGLDAGSPTLVEAVAGARCKHSERVGLLVIRAAENAPISVFGEIFDKPHPWYGEPKLSTDECDYYQYNVTGTCAGCGGGEICSRTGSCTSAPVLVADTRITLSVGSETQVIEAHPQGQLYGDVKLAGDTLALEIESTGIWISVAATTIPPQISGLQSDLKGSYMAPESLDITWDPTPEGTTFYTLIPINHHAAGPTYTECAVDASVGKLHVGEAMLLPLAVDTGLEFQGTEHVRFAAAETPRGCVEIRFNTHRSGGI